ncbi:glycosyltransferase [Thiocapsa rosea]|uniref:Glycosyltransferase involved in cell wall biosynthesis n=1 Tax=Thiocapsa rosea TaxID=69360 RepID=A0A495VFP8_9GAMM|nr:glycosyltransferase [Thiocapsa rosea]RKT47403.1 glycosyltransferase involved in cell wall biosynthesis [Thiocapsa rosea]
MKLLVDHGAYDNLGDLGMLEAALHQLRAYGTEIQLFVKDCPLDDRIWNLPGIERVDYHLPPPYKIPRRGGGIRARLLRALSPKNRRLLYLFLLAQGLTDPEQARVDVDGTRMAAIDWVARFDALFVAGGGDLNDVFDNEIWQRACLIHSFSALGKPIVLSGQQIGPIRHRASRQALARALRKVRLIGIREPTESVRICRMAQLDPGRYPVVGDDTFGLPDAESNEVRALLDAQGIESGRFIAVNIRVSLYSPVAEQSLRTLASQASALGRHYAMPVLVVPIALDPGDSDLASGQRLAEYAPKGGIQILHDVSWTPSLAKALLGQAFGALGVSYHFCTFALQHGVPAIALYDGDYYRQKALGLAAYWDDQRLAWPLSQPRQIQDMVAIFDDVALRARLATQAGQDAARWQRFFTDRVPVALGIARRSSTETRERLGVNGIARRARVSVITPFFNAAPFIAETIESVLAQSYCDWELLLIDDGSDDGSTQIAKAYAEQHPEQIRYLAHPNHANRGQGASRNLGLAAATGDFVAFIDADDVFLPHKLATQLAVLEGHPEADMVFGNTLYWHSWTGKPENTEKDHLPTFRIQTDTLVRPPTLVPILLGGAGAVPCICSFVAKRSLMDRIGGFDHAIGRLYEDQVLLAKLFCIGTVWVQSGYLERYRQREDSCWHRSMYSGEDKKSRIAFLRWLDHYLATSTKTDPRIRRLTRERFLTLQRPRYAALRRRLLRLAAPLNRIFPTTRTRISENGTQRPE